MITVDKILHAIRLSIHHVKSYLQQPRVLSLILPAIRKPLSSNLSINVLVACYVSIMHVLHTHTMTGKTRTELSYPKFNEQAMTVIQATLT